MYFKMSKYNKKINILEKIKKEIREIKQKYEEAQDFFSGKNSRKKREYF